MSADFVKILRLYIYSSAHENDSSLPCMLDDIARHGFLSQPLKFLNCLCK